MCEARENRYRMAESKSLPEVSFLNILCVALYFWFLKMLAHLEFGIVEGKVCVIFKWLVVQHHL